MMSSNFFLQNLAFFFKFLWSTLIKFPNRRFKYLNFKLNESHRRNQEWFTSTSNLNDLLHNLSRFWYVMSRKWRGLNPHLKVIKPTLLFPPIILVVIWFLTKSHFCHKSVKIHYISYLLVCLKHLKHSAAMESFFLSKISTSTFDWIDSPFERFIYADDKHSENSFGEELSPFDAK